MIKKTLKFVYIKIRYFLLSVLNCVIPKKNNQIFIFDKQFKKDNVWYIANFLTKNNYKDKYKLYYYVDNSSGYQNFSNLTFINNSRKTLWLQLRSKYIFYSYRGDGVKTFKSTRTQVIVDTMHGSPLKNIGYLASNSRFKKLWSYEKTFDYVLCLSDFFSEVIKKSFNASEEQCLVLGYPRNDIIFEEKRVIEKLGFQKEQFDSILLWMPTWRRNDENINLESNQDFPLLTEGNYEKFNNFLKETNILLIIKPHPFQATLEMFSDPKSNIKIIDNELLNENSIETYNLFNEVDALLTDYSSVYFDFLLTLKPIGFTIDDFNSYDNNRGFVVENPLEIMPGEKIKTTDELQQFIMDIKDGKDNYFQERVEVNNLVNKYKDGNSTKRLVDFLNM